MSTHEEPATDPTPTGDKNIAVPSTVALPLRGSLAGAVPLRSRPTSFHVPYRAPHGLTNRR